MSFSGQGLSRDKVMVVLEEEKTLAAEKFSFVTMRPQRAPVGQSFIQACWQISQSLCIVNIRPYYTV